MNKRLWVEMVFLTIVGTLLTACASPAVALARIVPKDTPICDEWARPEFGDYCYTDGLTVTSTDKITLLTWQYGMIQPHHATISAENVEFTDMDGNKIDPANMKNGVFYQFRKTGYEGKIYIEMELKLDKPGTHILLARP